MNRITSTLDRMVAYGMELGGIGLLGSSLDYSSRDLIIDAGPFLYGALLYVFGKLSNRQLDEERASAVSDLEKGME